MTSSTNIEFILPAACVRAIMTNWCYDVACDSGVSGLAVDSAAITVATECAAAKRADNAHGDVSCSRPCAVIPCVHGASGCAAEAALVDALVLKLEWRKPSMS